METEIIFPGVLYDESVVCAMREALGLVISLLAEKCLLWLLLETGSMPVHVFRGDVDDFDGIPNDDAGTLKDDDDIYKQGYNDEIEDHNMSGGEGSDDGDQEFEDNFGSYSDGGSDDDDDDDIDMEEYDDDDDETDEEDEDDGEDDKSNSEDSTDYNKPYPQLKNARDVYTSEDTFRLFEHELRKTRTLDIDVKNDMDLRDRGLEITYEVGKSWKYSGSYTVTVLPMDGIVECSCKYFESSGVLCSHAQVALKCLRIDKIPDRYRLQDNKITPGPAEGVDTLMKNQEDYRQSSPHQTEFNRYAGPGRDILSGFQADDGMRTDYIDPPLLRHASDVFSSNIFNIFREEYKKSEYLIAREDDIIIEGGLIVHYVVEKPGNYSYFSVPRHRVRAVLNDGTVNCICEKFEKTGLLCSHALVVLDYLCIVKIPGQYILDKFKKDETVSTVQEIHGPEYPKLRSFLIYRVFSKIFDELFVMTKSEESLQILESGLDELRDVLKGIKNDQESKEVDGNLPLASGKSTNDVEEQTEKEITGSHNDIQAQGCSTSQVFGKADESTIISGGSSCSSPPTNFGTQSDAADK